MSKSLPSGHPVLRVPVPVLVSWTQHAPGGCRCACALFHHGHGACTRAGEPGLLIRLDPADQRPVEGIDPDAVLAVCLPCYRALAAEGARPDTAQSDPLPDPGEHS
ncbi:DUF6372 family protein [Nocardia brasiliensis]|uniref:DUF6372 family protein n=1 Tax=Nocardia brasiliensis TaxID=37326 RepID=UPI002454BE33|nr:DUF6372 family protein [Nocardia brasiliensis]